MKPFGLRTVFRIFFRAAVALLVGIIALIVVFRWAPVPFTSLMIQRQVSAMWMGDKQFRLVHPWVGLEQISLYGPLAVLAAEDQKFFAHGGFDFDAMGKAIQVNPHRRLPLGASTISQQVAKNLFLWPGRSFIRKGVEACVTLLLEGLWSKRRILEVYCNVAEFGPGIFGVEAASRTYFQKPAARLTSAEAALLAAILPRPLSADPVHPTTYLRDRTRFIQRQMELMGGVAYCKQMVEVKR